MYQQEKLPPPWKNLLRWEKWPQVDFSDMEFWLLAEHRIFQPWVKRITVTKYTMPEFNKQSACNDVLILFLWRFW